MMNTATVVVLSVCLVIIVLALFQKNSNFLDIRGVFKEHLLVLTKSPLQFCAIIIVPMIISIIGAIYHPLSEGIVDNLNIVLSILISMFFAVLSILVSLTRKKGEKGKPLTPEERNYNTLLDQTFNAVIFESALCILLLVISFMQLFFNYFGPGVLVTIVSVVVYYLAIVIVLNIFVVIKRIRALFDNR